MFTIGDVLNGKNGKTFGSWMSKVQTIVQNKIGVSTHDIPDQPYMDWYEDEVSPKSAAARAIRGIME